MTNIDFLIFKNIHLMISVNQKWINSSIYIIKLKMEKEYIPIIDVSCLFQQNLDSQNCIKTAQQIDKACRQIGFFTIINHPISPKIFHSVMGKIKQFFNLPSQTKMALAPKKWNPESKNTLRGYFPSSVNGKEGMDICDPQRKQPPEQNGSLLKYEFIEYPKQLSEQWHKVIREYYAEMHRIAMIMLQIIFRHFGRGEQFKKFSKNLSRSVHTSTLRFNYYPQQKSETVPVEISAEDGVLLACDTHVDAGILTLLSQDCMGGLQVKTKLGKWHTVPYNQNALIINTGRTLQLLTNGEYSPTIHRVLMNSGQRISVPFFLTPSFNTKLDPTVLTGGQPQPQFRQQLFEQLLWKEMKKLKQYDRWSDEKK